MKTVGTEDTIRTEDAIGTADTIGNADTIGTEHTMRTAHTIGNEDSRYWRYNQDCRHSRYWRHNRDCRHNRDWTHNEDWIHNRYWRHTDVCLNSCKRRRNIRSWEGSLMPRRYGLHREAQNLTFLTGLGQSCHPVTTDHLDPVSRPQDLPDARWLLASSPAVRHTNRNDSRYCAVALL